MLHVYHKKQGRTCTTAARTTSSTAYVNAAGFGREQEDENRQSGTSAASLAGAKSLCMSHVEGAPKRAGARGTARSNGSGCARARGPCPKASYRQRGELLAAHLSVGQLLEAAVLHVTACGLCAAQKELQVLPHALWPQAPGVRGWRVRLTAQVIVKVDILQAAVVAWVVCAPVLCAATVHSPDVQAARTRRVEEPAAKAGPGAGRMLRDADQILHRDTNKLELQLLLSINARVPVEDNEATAQHPRTLPPWARVP